MKEPYARGRAYLSGETVTAGSFACERCGAVHAVEEGKITNLPVCPQCQNDTWGAAPGSPSDQGRLSA